MKDYELIVIGGGPAGLAAALAAWEGGLRRILVAERDSEPGGILNQCIHSGFGLHYFGEELTGPEYAERFIDLLAQTDIEFSPDTMVLELTSEKEVHMVSKAGGYRIAKAQSIVLAMGCRERTRGAIGIPGTRPAGVLTAGAAQRYVNIEGYLPGRRVVILGSGDIGLIMARRMTLEGAKVLACVEIMPHSGGLARNITQCLDDFGIPLYLSHTITEIRGLNRVEQVVVSKVDQNRVPVPGSEMVFDCDTLLLSVGLIPENELSRQAGVEIDRRTGGAVVDEHCQTTIPGIFACGNALHVHDLVDFVTEESRRAGFSAAEYVKADDTAARGGELNVGYGEGVSYAVPQLIRDKNADTEVLFRVGRIYKNAEVLALVNGEVISLRRGRMAPGEMERITLPKSLLRRAEGEITLYIGEVTP